MHLKCNNHAASFTREEALVDEFCPLTDAAVGIPEGEYTFVYDYPLSTAAKFMHALPADVSIIDILLEARADYRAIYAIEDASSSVTASQIPGVINRPPTSGTYGIWGHDITDLYFEGVEIDTIKRRVTFSIGS